MRVLLTLNIDNIRNIEILSRNEEQTVYYFDEIIVLYHIDNQKYVLFDDYACEGVKALHNILERVIKGEFEYNSFSSEKGIGYYWNLSCDELYKGVDNYEQPDELIPMMWCTTNKYANATWVYSYDGKIYIEVSPIYKWFGMEQSDDTEYMPFEEFKNNYKIRDIAAIDHNALLKLLEECRVLLSKMKV